MELEQLKGKNWVATLMLCWSLGLYGAHRFYTGKSVSAWVMVALTVLGLTAPISAIWALVDGFCIALGKFAHADGSELYERINWLGYVYIAVMILAVLFIALYGLMIIGVMAAAIAGEITVNGIGEESTQGDIDFLIDFVMDCELWRIH